MSNRQIPEHHEGLLKSALKLDEEDNIPEDVAELYWDAARTARRIGSPVTGDMLVMVCLMLNRATKPDPVSFLTADPAPKYGEKVLAEFRGDWHWGTLQSVKGKKVIVQLDDDTAEEREFDPTKVRRPCRDEKKLIGV